VTRAAEYIPADAGRLSGRSAATGGPCGTIGR
jgi:hypothetical protein